MNTSASAAPPLHHPPPAWLRAWRTLRSLWRSWFLWLLLALLVLGLLVTVVWLAGRHEVQQVQERLERDTADAAADLRADLARNMQSLQALQASRDDAARWTQDADTLLRDHREWLRIEWRDAQLQTLAAADTPYRGSPFSNARHQGVQAEMAQACEHARSVQAGAYSRSYFVPLADPLTGLEAMDACVPMPGGGFVVATYAMRGLLTEFLDADLMRGQEASLVEPDGTRLAAVGVPRRAGNRVFSAAQTLELPGAALFVLRVTGWRTAPDLFPNVLTGLVTGMSIALVSVLALLARDTRRRLAAERELSDALAFRKAMENSLITGLRARDLHGRITYVNPAFCAMVGYTAEELLGTPEADTLYWPAELTQEYRARQAQRQAAAGAGAGAHSGFESEFQRKDGTRFPVLIFETPLVNAQRVQTGWMSAFVDLSEQRRIEEISRASLERLQASARLATVGEMASLMSHELTQPLAAIASYANGSMNLLAHAAQAPGGDAHAPRALHAVHAPLDAQAQGDLALAIRRIAEQAERAGQVIRSVHDFVRRRDRTREAVAPRALVEAVMPLVRLQARKIGAQVRVEVPAELPRVQCDRTLVEQVLLNLVRNGMQAMAQPDPPGLPEPVERVLTLRAEHVPPGAGLAGALRQWVAFSVSDLGSGIDEAVNARLFTPFFTTRPDGMGLGLSLCRTVVEQHGGALLHQPHSPRGTTFRFTLPVAPAAAPAPCNPPSMP